MRLVCPSCAAEYEVPDEAVPVEGRDVQCGTCSTSWFQERQFDQPPAAAARVDEPAQRPSETPDQAPSPDEGTAVAEPESERESPPASDEDHGIQAEAAVEVPVADTASEVAEPDAMVEPEPPEAAAEPEPAAPVEAEPEVEAEEEPEPVAEAVPEPTARPETDMDLDFDFDFEDDDPAPGAAAEPEAAEPEPEEPETTRVGGFDKSLHTEATDGRPKSPSWERETPELAVKPPPQPEDLSAPVEEPLLSDDDNDLLAAVRGELDKLDDTPGSDGDGSALSARRTGIAAAAQASGIVFDEEFEDDDFSATAHELGETLQQDELEDLSAPEPEGRGPQFSIGFATAAILFALAFAAYLLGPSISESYPPAAPYLTTYARTVDQTRRVVEELSSNALGFAEDKMNETDGS